MDGELIVPGVQVMEAVPITFELLQPFPLGFQVVFRSIILSTEDSHIFGHGQLIEVEGVHRGDTLLLLDGQRYALTRVCDAILNGLWVSIDHVELLELNLAQAVIPQVLFQAILQRLNDLIFFFDLQTLKHGLLEEVDALGVLPVLIIVII